MVARINFDLFVWFLIICIGILRIDLQASISLLNYPYICHTVSFMYKISVLIIQGESGERI